MYLNVSGNVLTFLRREMSMFMPIVCLQLSLIMSTEHAVCVVFISTLAIVLWLCWMGFVCVYLCVLYIFVNI